MQSGAHARYHIRQQKTNVWNRIQDLPCLGYLSPTQVSVHCTFDFFCISLSRNRPEEEEEADGLEGEPWERISFEHHVYAGEETSRLYEMRRSEVEGEAAAKTEQNRNSQQKIYLQDKIICPAVFCLLGIFFFLFYEILQI